MVFVQACDPFEDDDEDTPVPAAPLSSITEIAASNENFSILVQALQTTGLDATLADETQTFTVFAPTNNAFAALLAALDVTAEELLAREDLTDILLYHVLPGQVNAEAAIAAAGTRVATVNGADIGVSLFGGSLFVNQATVTTPDLAEASNGIIHEIDAVILPPTEPGTPTDNIVETAVAAGFTTLADLLVSTGLDETLSNAEEEFTVFAPTNEAFAALGDNILTSLGENPEVLEAILLQHVVVGATVDSITAFTLQGNDVETAGGAMIPLGLNAMTDRLTIGGASVTMPDVYTSNGVIHVINSVIVGDVEVPRAGDNIVEVAVANGNFTVLASALIETGLDAVLSDEDREFTVFAPTDAAFTKLLAALGVTAEELLAREDLSDILLYHVLADTTVLADAALMVAQSDMNIVTTASGVGAALSVSDDTLYVNTSVVSGTDVVANNGVIHVVDQVILPPAMRGEPTLNIVETAQANEAFSTLVDLVIAADLVDALSDENASLTVFAPTNAAFDKVPDTALAAVGGDVDLLTGVLQQHVIASEISSVAAFAANGANVDTLANEDVSVRIVNHLLAANDMTTEVAYDAATGNLVGGMGSSQPGFTLYTFDNDLGSDTSNCNGGCADAWPPVLVTDGDVSSIPGLSVIMRDDDTMQAAYLGRPLYFFANDMAAGDTTGDGINNVWAIVNLPEVVLQINGSNVTTTDIYTTNGVIHVIDTVILETVE